MSQVEETNCVICIIDESIGSMRGNNNASYIQLDKFIVCTEFVTDTTVGGIHLDLSTGVIPHVNQTLVASVLLCFQYIISSPSIFSYILALFYWCSSGGSRTSSPTLLLTTPITTSFAMHLFFFIP